MTMNLKNSLTRVFIVCVTLHRHMATHPTPTPLARNSLDQRLRVHHRLTPANIQLQVIIIQTTSKKQRSSMAPRRKSRGKEPAATDADPKAEVGSPAAAPAKGKKRKAEAEASQAASPSPAAKKGKASICDTEDLCIHTIVHFMF